VAGRFYRPELDVLRLMAFLMIFFRHAVPPRRAWLHSITEVGALGVCLFFVLSAYLITELLHLERTRTGTIKIGAFYVRRVLRIWPLQWFILAVAAVFGWFYPPFHVPGKAFAFLLLFLGNWYVGLHGFFPGFIGQLWSISIEEQFYLLWPGLMLLRERVAMVFAAATIPTAAIALIFLARSGANPNTAIWTNSLVQFQMFGMGALLAYGLRDRVPRLSGVVRVLLFGLAVALYGASYTSSRSFQPGQSAAPLIAEYLLAGIGSCVFLISFLGLPMPPWTKSLRYLGKISYGLYVYHGAAIYLTNYVVGSAPGTLAGLFKAGFALGLTIGCSALSYQFLERPFIRFKERFTVVRTRMA
jgi:peptidoglycan/LPS O-acetylase OafA/YrhL